jgi:hypothetical protein
MVDVPQTEPATASEVRPTAVRGFAAVLLVVFLVGATARIATLGHSIDYIDEMMSDDSYIYLAIARSLAAGHGPICAGVPTGGFQPLFAMLVAPLFVSIANDPDVGVEVLDLKARQMLAILVTFSLLCMGLIALLLYRIHGAGAAVILGVSSWVSNEQAMRMTYNGLETIVAVFFLLVCCYVFEIYNGPDARPIWRILLGVCLGLAGLARIDLLFLGAIVLGVFLWRAARGSQSVRSTVVSLLLVGAGFSAIYFPWLAYIYSYTGRIYPVSGEAVRHLGSLASEQVPSYTGFLLDLIASSYFNADPFSTVVPFVAIPFALLTWYRHRERWAVGFLSDVTRYRLPILMGAFVVLAYVFHIKVHWYLVRYVFPVYPALLLVTCALVHRIDLSLGARGRAALLVIAAVGPLVAGALHHHVRTMVVGYPGRPTYRGAALATKNMVPEGTVVGAWESGALSYYTPKLDIVNLDGVVDETAFEHVRNRTLDLYLRERGVILVVGTVNSRSFVLTHSTVVQPERFQELALVPAYPSAGQWYVYGYRER